MRTGSTTEELCGFRAEKVVKLIPHSSVHISSSGFASDPLCGHYSTRLQDSRVGSPEPTPKRNCAAHRLLYSREELALSPTRRRHAQNPRFTRVLLRIATLDYVLELRDGARASSHLVSLPTKPFEGALQLRLRSQVCSVSCECCRTFADADGAQSRVLDKSSQTRVRRHEFLRQENARPRIAARLASRSCGATTRAEAAVPRAGLSIRSSTTTRRQSHAQTRM